MIMNPVTEAQLRHRSIRQYTGKRQLELIDIFRGGDNDYTPGIIQELVCHQGTRA